MRALAIRAKISARVNVGEVIALLLDSGLLYCFFEDVVSYPKMSKLGRVKY
jgi:hypothetical protein